MRTYIWKEILLKVVHKATISWIFPLPFALWLQFSNFVHKLFDIQFSTLKKSSMETGDRRQKVFKPIKWYDWFSNYSITGPCSPWWANIFLRIESWLISVIIFGKNSEISAIVSISHSPYPAKALKIKACLCLYWTLLQSNLLVRFTSAFLSLESIH